MNFNEYQKKAWKTAIYPNKGNNLIYPTLGLNGETGEVAEKVKKLIRDNKNFADQEFFHTMRNELGDVLWYVAALCMELGVDMNVVAEMNLEKLQDRQDRNKLHGSGDDR
jgi:NTP pyrophosphatase (non-canonical NTP hydrolase)